MKTYSPKPEHVVRRWLVIDAGGQVLGRVASEAAALLRGKHKPIFAPHMDTGDNVIIVNADKVELTGGKETKKIAYRHSGYPGGLTATAYGRLMADRPVFVVEKAIKGMLPKNRLGRAMFRKLHVVPGPDHPHQAQKPVPYTLGEPIAWEGLPQQARSRVAGPDDDADQATPRKPAAKKPTTRTPAAKKPTARKPAARKPTVKKSTASTSAASKPTAKKPTAKRPTAKQPTAKKPTAKKSTAASAKKRTEE
jgi:large subunit ribosomal protein L13